MAAQLADSFFRPGLRVTAKQNSPPLLRFLAIPINPTRCTTEVSPSKEGVPCSPCGEAITKLNVPNFHELTVACKTTLQGNITPNGNEM